MKSAAKTTLSLGLGSVFALLAAPALGQSVAAPPSPENILPSPAATPSPAASPSPTPSATPAAQPAPGTPVIAPVITAIDEPVMKWPVETARALHSVIKAIGAEGLVPADYEPDQLAAAISGIVAPRCFFSRRSRGRTRSRSHSGINPSVISTTVIWEPNAA